MTRATVTSKGQVTIPKSIRLQAHIGTGMELDFSMHQGQIIVTPVKATISSLKGIVKSKKRRPVSVKEMNQAIKKRAGRNV